jgi:hypothetical protein
MCDFNDLLRRKEIDEFLKASLISPYRVEAQYPEWNFLFLLPQ